MKAKAKSKAKKVDPTVYILIEFYDRVGTEYIHAKTTKSVIDRAITIASKTDEQEREQELEAFLEDVSDDGGWWLSTAIGSFIGCGNLCDVDITDKVHPIAQWKKRKRASVSDEEFIAGFALTKTGAKAAMNDARTNDDYGADEDWDD